MAKTDHTEGFEAAVLQRLNQIIVLLLRAAASGPDQGPTEQIVQLHALGMKPVEIATVLGKKTNYVGAVLHQARKKSAKKTRRKTTEETA